MKSLLNKESEITENNKLIPRSIEDEEFNLIMSIYEKNTRDNSRTIYKIEKHN